MALVEMLLKDFCKVSAALLRLSIPGLLAVFASVELAAWMGWVSSLKLARHLQNLAAAWSPGCTGLKHSVEMKCVPVEGGLELPPQGLS